ncbi:hypothetical protein KUCAC02_008300 [Chaenocephalus aceratus]|uniref:Uncharacterized protein n=1 Tax=Chaenocephalus aceratus TaxID=36190 RepID=A0ACB9X8P7_CHAAC|nr:hypothetical protein KUCAC02_008300 [Chaenocephalus aceratus]
MAYRHLKKFKIDPILYMTEWFMCIFSRTLPWASVLRVWDMFFCEGVKIVFRVGLVLLKQMLGSVDKLRELQGMYETMERLRNIAPDAIREEILVQEIIILPVTESLIERESNIQVRKWRESRGELTPPAGPPPPRASSSLLSLPGFRRSKAPFHSQAKKGSFSGPSGVDSRPVVTSSSERGPSHKPPIPPGAGQRAPAPQVRSLLVRGAEGSSQGPAQAPEDPPAHEQPAASALTQSTAPPPNTLSPAPKIVSEQITPTLPSPTANNSTLTLIQDSNKEASPAYCRKDRDTPYYHKHLRGRSDGADRDVEVRRQKMVARKDY